MAHPPSRRRFLMTTLGVGVTAGASQACWRHRHRCYVQPCPPTPDPYPPDPGPTLRERCDVRTLTGPALASLRKGVAVMKALPASDRRSWAFQAAIHGTTGSSADPLFNQCQHGTLQFFTWHRAYLYFFERILRWAAGDPALTLPYWDWSASPTLPEAFRAPADPAANPLYEALRKANDGSALPATVVVNDLDTALGQTAFGGPTGFSPGLEDSPHGAVHGLVGGPGGLMSTVPTAARDPIFWLHHANIDRLWNVWLNQGGGRANPSDAAFLDRAYSFADETGGVVTVKVREVIDATALGYRYCGLPNPRLVVHQQPVAASSPAPPVVAATSAAADAAAAPLERVEARPLGFQEERVKLNVVRANRAALAAPAAVRATAGEAGKVLLKVEGVAADDTPEVAYGVYLNLPEGDRTEEAARAYYVGTINFFGKTKADKRGLGHGHAHAGGAEFDATFDATKLVGRLQRAGRFDPDAVTVSILPLAVGPPGVTADQVKARAVAAAKAANVTYKRVSVLVTGEQK